MSFSPPSQAEELAARGHPDRPPIDGLLPAGKLAAALAWAAKGLPVFPLQCNSKLPICQGWNLSATTDPELIRVIWTDPVLGIERDYNIGVLTSDLVVLDIDVKNGKPGLQTFSDLGLNIDTLTVGTPTGGLHLYYRALSHRVGQSPIGTGIDVRSFNGFVVAPGSTINGTSYTVHHDSPIAEFPKHLRHKLKPPRQRAEAAASVELDLPESVEIARHYLRHNAPPAIEGQNGDDTLYRVCCRLHDFGVTEFTALQLLLEEYNEKCAPPWSPDELQNKVGNAYRYATGGAGSASLRRYSTAW